jgi:protein TonB
MASPSSTKRSWLSFLLALTIYASAWLLVSHYQPLEVVEPVKDVTPLMRLITTIEPVAKASAPLSESLSVRPAKLSQQKKATPAPAAPRKAVAKRKAHKAVVTQPKPSVPASTETQTVAVLPTAQQLPDNIGMAAKQEQVSPEVVPAQPALSSSAIKDIANAYRIMVHERIATLQTYPDDARRLGEEGTVLVRFTILASGKVERIIIVESSGSERLDAATLAIFTEGLNHQLPPIPIELNKQEWTLSLPIRYQLQSG